jgi:glycosyltransferase involved in cell wall biosynthesis
LIVPPAWSYHWNRLSSQMHRLRVMIHSKGLGALLSKLSAVPTAYTSAAARTIPPTVAMPPRKGRLLFVDATTPRPDRDSGSLRAFNIMKRLLHDGYAVDFLAVDAADAGSYNVALQSIGVTVHAGVRAATHPRWLAGHGRQFDAVVVSRHHVASYWIPLARRLAPKARLVFDSVDLHHLREAREAELTGNDALRRCAEATQRREMDAMRAADVTWVVSPVEKALLGSRLPHARIEVVPNLHETHATNATPGERQGLLFVGGGGHPPNVDAVRWLLAEIHPMVRERLPGCVLHVVGDGIDDKVAEAATPRDGVVFHGHVPDLAPLLSTCVAGLAPLRFGAGVKGKVNQYMAHGLPTVATDCAVEGMHLVHRHDVLVANDTAGFAQAIVTLHQDPAAWARLSTNGLANVSAHFSPGSADAAFAATFGKHRITDGN